MRVERIDADHVEVTAGDAAGRLELSSRRIVAPDHLLVTDVLVKLALSYELPRRGALLLHASATEIGEGAVVSFGASGAGKTTVARAFGTILSDELVVLHHKAPGSWDVQGTPWWHGRSDRVPVSRLVWLRRGNPSSVRPIAGAALLRGVLSEAQWFSCANDRVADIVALAGELAARGGLQVDAEVGRLLDVVAPVFAAAEARPAWADGWQ